MATDTPVPTDALLPCPFCGAKASGYEIAPHSHSGLLKALGIPDHGGSYAIEGDCNCGSGLIGATQAEVTARWNRRAQPARLEVDSSGKPHIVRLAEDFAEDCIRAGYVTTNADSHRRLMDAARAQPAPADSVLEDAERLDWLALAGPTSICVAIDRAHDGEVEVSTDDVTGYGKTLRAAIDAARKQGANHD